VTLTVGWQFDALLLCEWVDVTPGEGFVVQNKWAVHYCSEQWNSNIFHPLFRASKPAMFQFSPSKYYHAVPTRKGRHNMHNILTSKTGDSYQSYTC
jgi:hypothetical protein